MTSLHRGELKVAEVASRFTNLNEFIALITELGFNLKSKVRELLRLMGHS